MSADPDPAGYTKATMLPRSLLVLFAVSAAAFAQVTPDQFAAIRKEGLANSQVMAHLDHLVNRIGPRLTSSDNLTNACEWARDTFQSFGIENAHLEQWGDFEVGFNRGPWWGRMTQPRSDGARLQHRRLDGGHAHALARQDRRRAPKNSRRARSACRASCAKVWLLNLPSARS
jgi:hypothetical protein